MPRCESCNAEFSVPDNPALPLAATYCRNCLRDGLEHVRRLASLQGEAIRDVIAAMLQALNEEEANE